jgi:hypothetical protein
MYLQEQGKLIPFYREFKKTATEDPTGAAALKTVTGKSPAELEPAWREWVLALNYKD